MLNRTDVVVRKTLRVLTILVGVIGVVSFVQRLLNVGVVPVAKELIGYYREIAEWIFVAPMSLFGIKIPLWLADVWALSFVGASAYVWTPRIEQSRFFRMHQSLTQKEHWKVWVLFLFGISGAGLFILLGAVSPSTYIRGFHEEPLDLSKGAARNTLYIFGGAAVFFVFNAFTPSV